MVTQEFVQGGKWSLRKHYEGTTDGYASSYASHTSYADYTDDFGVVVQALQERVSSLEHLDNAACIKAYQPSFITERRSVLIVSDALGISNGVIRFNIEQSDQASYDWLCDPVQDLNSYSCDASTLIKNPDNWTLSGGTTSYGPFLVVHPVLGDLVGGEVGGPVGGPVSGPVGGHVDAKVLYCLSEPLARRESCQLGASVPILIVVTVCNLVKILCLMATHWIAEDDLLVTTGDAIESFLLIPDTTTANQDSTNPATSSQKNKGWLVDSDSVIRRWKPLPRKFFDADNGTRWLICVAP